MINVKINQNDESFPEGSTILDLCKSLKINIPTLCNNDFLKPYGGCRLCLVEVAQEKHPKGGKLLPACCTTINEGQIIETHSEKVQRSRKFILQLLLARSPESEEIKELAKEWGALNDGNPNDLVGEYLLTRTEKPRDTKCILCSLCVRVCAEIPERHAISFYKRGMEKEVRTPFDKVAESCIGCGCCAYVCPTNTITIEEVS